MLDGSETRGRSWDGRKRHIVVDTLGLPLVALVHSADIQDRDGARALLWRLKGRFSRLRLLWADASYAGKLVDWTRRACHWTLAIVRRREEVQGFEVLPRRWVVERTFAWLGRYRRLSKDYEQLSQNRRRNSIPGGLRCTSRATAALLCRGCWPMWRPLLQAG